MAADFITVEVFFSFASVCLASRKAFKIIQTKPPSGDFPGAGSARLARCPTASRLRSPPTPGILISVGILAGKPDALKWADSKIDKAPKYWTRILQCSVFLAAFLCFILSSTLWFSVPEQFSIRLWFFFPFFLCMRKKIAEASSEFPVFSLSIVHIILILPLDDNYGVLA